MNLYDIESWFKPVSHLDPRRQAIIHAACNHLGVKEVDGANRGPEIDEWNRRCGVPLGSPWCASFASWCISTAGEPEVKIASALALGARLRNPTFITPGDVMYFQTGPETGHCGIVVAVGPGEVACIEGNHGDQVALVRRSTNEVHFCTNLDDARPAIPDGLPMVPARYAGTR